MTLRVLPPAPSPPRFSLPPEVPSQMTGGLQRDALLRLRVLAVDDNEDAVVLLAKLLEHHGHNALYCTSGAEALAVGADFAPDVVILDLGMPGLNGFETAGKIREQPWGRTVQLVALTGWGQPDDIRQTLAAGFHTHLVKPLDINRLLDWLQKQ